MDDYLFENFILYAVIAFCIVMLPFAVAALILLQRVDKPKQVRVQPLPDSKTTPLGVYREDRRR